MLEIVYGSLIPRIVQQNQATSNHRNYRTEKKKKKDKFQQRNCSLILENAIFS